MNQVIKRPAGAIDATNGTGSKMDLRPSNMEECYRLAGAIFQSGMGPKGINQQAIMITMMAGMELGIGPITALRGVAVINNRVTIYGDLMTSLVRQRGHKIRSWYAPDSGPDITAHAELIRGDTGEKTLRSFSIQDAKQAKLIGKSGPWTEYPKRMLMWRAVSWACRDGASDALLGMMAYEEAIDIPATPAIEGRATPSPASVSNEVNAQRTPRGKPQTVAATLDVGELLMRLPSARDPGGWLFETFESYLATAVLPWIEQDEIHQAATKHADDLVRALADIQAEDEEWGAAQVFEDWQSEVRGRLL